MPSLLSIPFCSQLRAKRSKSSFRQSQSEASRRAWELEISPENLLIFSHSLAIKILIFFRILLMGILEIPVKFAILVASISSVKYLRISLNFFCEIRERTIYLFFIDRIIVLVLAHSLRKTPLKVFNLSWANINIALKPYFKYHKLLLYKV